MGIKKLFLLQSNQAFYQPRVVAPQTGSKDLSRRLVDKSKIVIFKPTEKNWQECAARNWAAGDTFNWVPSPLKGDIFY